MESKVKYLIDAALMLKASGTVAITSTETTAKVDINRIANGRGDVTGRYGEGSIDVLLHVVAIDHTTGDETYTLGFTTYDSAGANAVTQETATLLVGDLGLTKVFKFDMATLQTLDSDAAQFAIVVTLAGTSPILQYWAYIVPNRRRG